LWIACRYFPDEAAHGLAFGAAFAGAAGDVCAGARVVAHADQRDGVERSVEAPVAAAVEPVAGGVA
jgi:hypothetical protein